MLSLLVAVHDRLAIAETAMAILLGLLGTFQFLTKRQVSGGFRSGFLLMGALTAVQGILGAVALVTGGHPKTLLHIVYGIFAVAFIPGVYVYTRNRKPDTEAAILAVACWVTAIAFFRGFMTGG